MACHNIIPNALTKQVKNITVEGKSKVIVVIVDERWVIAVIVSSSLNLG